MKSRILKNIVLGFSLLITGQIYSQSCGFGCLGLSGVFGGYSVQQYKADGLNNYLNDYIHIPYLSLTTADEFGFKEGMGFKVGINLVRADYSNFFFTFKGFYQFLSEEQTIKLSDGLGYEMRYDATLKMDNWGFGLDLGIPLGSFVDWKIIDGEVIFFSPKVSINNYYNNPEVKYVKIDNTFTPNTVKTGFAVGSGLIFNLIEDYVSLEIGGMFTFIEIDYLTNDESGDKIPNETDSKLVSEGGLKGTVQLNIGIPF